MDLCTLCHARKYSYHVMFAAVLIQGSIETSVDHSSSLLLLQGDEESSLREELKVKKGEEFDPIPVQLLRKYVGYARKYVHPRIGEEAAQVLQVRSAIYTEHVCTGKLYSRTLPS